MYRTECLWTDPSINTNINLLVKFLLHTSGEAVNEERSTPFLLSKRSKKGGFMDTDKGVGIAGGRGDIRRLNGNGEKYNKD